MNTLVAVLALALWSSSAFAIETAAVLGPQRDIALMKDIDARHNAMKARLEAAIAELEGKIAALSNCGKQRKFYDEGTDQCE